MLTSFPAVSPVTSIRLSLGSLTSTETWEAKIKL